MKERPILFSGEMVRAIPNGKKTQTRRVVKPQPPEGHRQCSINGNAAFTNHPLQGEKGDVINARGSYGDVGDRLWVRETWAMHENDKGADCVLFRADVPDPENYGPWRPSIFMPRWASRITLEITGVRVERLQDITEDDAKAEGVDDVDTFHFIWNEINHKRGYGWRTNPWVWVIEFKKVSA